MLCWSKSSKLNRPPFAPTATSNQRFQGMLTKNVFWIEVFVGNQFWVPRTQSDELWELPLPRSLWRALYHLVLFWLLFDRMVRRLVTLPAYVFRCWWPTKREAMAAIGSRVHKVKSSLFHYLDDESKPLILTTHESEGGVGMWSFCFCPGRFSCCLKASARTSGWSQPCCWRLKHPRRLRSGAASLGVKKVTNPMDMARPCFFCRLFGSIDLRNLLHGIL